MIEKSFPSYLQKEATKIAGFLQQKDYLLGSFLSKCVPQFQEICGLPIISNHRKIIEMKRFITQKDQIIAQMRAELSTTIEEDRYYTEANITDCNSHLEAFLAQLERSNQVLISRPISQKLYESFASNSLLSTILKRKKCLSSFGDFCILAIPKSLLILFVKPL